MIACDVSDTVLMVNKTKPLFSQKHGASVLQAEFGISINQGKDGVGTNGYPCKENKTVDSNEILWMKRDR